MSNLIDLITPTNLDSEREKFFASTSYNPTFHYIWQDVDLKPIFSSENKYPLWESIKKQDHISIVQSASSLFDTSITDEFTASAYQQSSVIGRLSTGSAQEYARLFQNALDEFDISDYKIILTDSSGFNARPNHNDKTITISNQIHFEYFSMEAGVRHELVHVIRYKNGIYNHIKRADNYLPTEEGLASWCQDNTNDDNGFTQHAIEYVASSVGIKGSLRDIFDTMCDFGMSAELAWKRASRHKFGFVDTSIPGDIIKPALYYANEIKVDKLTTDEKLRLFVGKISMDDLGNYPDYIGLWPAIKLVQYFKL